MRLHRVNHTLLNRRVDFFFLTIENEQFAQDMSDVMMLNPQSTHRPKILRPYKIVQFVLQLFKGQIVNVRKKIVDYEKMIQSLTHKIIMAKIILIYAVPEPAVLRAGMHSSIRIGFYYLTVEAYISSILSDRWSYSSFHFFSSSIEELAQLH